MAEKLYHWSDGDGGYPTETWCGIPFYLGEDYDVPNEELGGESLAYVMAEEGAEHVTCPTCLQMLVENRLLDDD